jgi:TonB-dependent receptor
MERKLLVIAILIFLTSSLFSQKGIVKGKITDKLTGEEIVGAAVIIEGTTIGTATNFTGDFNMNVEPGTYNFRCQFISYEPLVMQSVTIQSGVETVLNFNLVSAELKLDEVKVVARANRESEAMLLVDQKISLISKETIGARQLSVQGISDAASAVSRITGVTRQEGSQTINVRGLGDRYNTTTLNGLPLPSNHAEYKNIDLALFPSDVIGYLSVEKSFTANLIGDVGGANVDIVSKYHTGDPFLEVGVSTGYNLNLSNADEFFLQQGMGYFGFDNSSTPYNIGAINNYAFKNSLNPQKQNPLPDTDFSLSGGKTYKLTGGELQLFATGSFDNAYNYKEIIKRKVNGSNDMRMDLKGEEFSYTIQSSAMLNMSYSKAKSQYYLSSLFLNSSNQNLSNLNPNLYIDVISDSQESALLRRMEYERNVVLVNQLMGKHDFSKGFSLNWKLGFNHVDNMMPDRTNNIFILSNSGIYTPATNDAANNHRYFHSLMEDELSATFELTKSFGGAFNGSDYRGKITLGYFGRNKERSFEAYQYNFRLADRINPGTIDPSNPDAYFNNERMQQGIFSIVTFFGANSRPQTYSGSQLMNAGFLTFEYALSTRLSGLLGVRVEQVLQKVDYATSIKIGNNSFNEFTPLPSLSLRYAATDKQNVRLTSSMSYTLPQFKESAPFLFEGITEAIIGNPYLHPSKIYNAELKWEYFPGGTELISLAAYGKYIKDPINRFVMASASNDFSYANSGDMAYVYGLELEMRKNIIETEVKGGTRRLSVGINASGMKTLQKLDKTKVKTETKNFVIASFNTENEELEGSAPLLANANATYQRIWTDKEISYTASVVYGYTSERLYLIGSSSLGNQYDESFNELNVILKANIKKLGLSLSGKNLMNPDFVRVQKNESQQHVVSSYSKGIKLSLGLSYKF